ncbi:MAG: hypothetical protein E7168_00960 [Firmicutes bacterium]|nr:hypothetical protein [Bacillota bacterium]
MKKRKRKKVSFIKLYGKDIFNAVMAFIGVTFSFFVLDIYLRNLIFSVNPFYPIKNLSSNLFTFSFIFFIAGILVLLKKENRIKFYSGTLFISNILFYINASYFLETNKLLNIEEIVSSVKLITSIKIDLLLIILLSFSFMIIACFYMNKISNYKRDSYYYIYTILLMIIFVGGFKGSATTLLGPEIISNQNKLYPKNIYLENKNIEENLEVSGFYEYQIRQTWKLLKSRYYELEKEE